MTYEVKWTSRAKRQLSESLPICVLDAVYLFVNGPLLENPYRVEKRLRVPLEGKFSARRGSYRIIYSIHADIIVIHSVNHRADAYKTP